MGWGRTFLLGDIGNRLDIADAEREIEGIRSRLRQSRTADESQDLRLERLERENDELKLSLASLVRLLVAKDVVTQAELARFVAIIDP